MDQSMDGWMDGGMDRGAFYEGDTDQIMGSVVIVGGGGGGGWIDRCINRCING